MIGVILAAGMAKRLRPLTDECPKCLLRIGNRSLLERIINAMICDANCNEIVIVTGYKASMIREFISKHYPHIKITFLHNEDFKNNNNIYSLWMAGKIFKGNDVLLMDSDILCDPKAVKRIGMQPQSSLAVQRHELGEEEIKVIVDIDGNIVALNKTCNPADAIGESVGIEKMTAEYTTALCNELDTMIEKEGLINVFYEQAFERMIMKGHTFSVIDTTDCFSIELDTPEDFERAQELIPDELY